MLDSTAVLSRHLAAMCDKNTLLKLLMRIERGTGALAIENHHIYRSYTILGSDNGVTAPLPRVTSRYLIFPMVIQYENEVQRATHVPGPQRIGTP